MDLIDIHAHILPGLDNGAQDLKQSLAMAEAAQIDGISLLVATPRVSWEEFNNCREDILEHVRKLNQCLKYARMRLPVLPGAEYCLEPELLKRLAAGQLLTINDTGRYLLVKLPNEEVTEYTGNILHALQLQGVTPIIANPEENPWMAKSPDILMNFASRGILSQVTSGSITGLFGRRVKKAALKFLESGAAQLIASNGQTSKGREPVLYPAFQEIEDRWGVEFARILTFRNPNFVIKGLPLKPEFKPTSKRARWNFSTPSLRRL